MLPIRRNVPMPKIEGRVPPPPRRKYPFDQMEIGDMFFVPNKKKNTISTHISTEGNSRGMKLATRLCHMRQTEAGWEPANEGEPGAVQGVGVWRQK